MTQRAFRLLIFLSLTVVSFTATLSVASNTALDHIDKEWQHYFETSEHYRKLDSRLMHEELQSTKLQEPIKPPYADRFGFDPNNPSTWYSTPSAKPILNIILSFQTPSGGWSKRTDMSQHPRQKGEAFGIENGYIPTFDNDATTTQLRMLANAATVTDDQKYRAAFLKGLSLILDAQYPNGGWPQNFPLTGDYHDHITYNDNVMTNILSLLLEITDRKPPFQFVPADMREKSAIALKDGVECILKTQVVVDDKLTIWGAQHNRTTLLPVAARKFEPVALASKESAVVVAFLMDIPKPDTQVINAIEDAMDWYKKAQIFGYRWELEIGVRSALVKEPGAGPLWARFYEINSNRPIFGDRDGSIHYNVNEISKERQIKYGWYTNEPIAILNRYPMWKDKLNTDTDKN